MSGNGEFNAYYLRRIGVAPPLAEMLAGRKPESEAANPAQSRAKPQRQADSPAPSPVTAASQPAADNPPAYGDLADLDSAASTCTACALSESRTQVVFGVGSERPDVLFIGEAPGEQEDLQGEPFVGRAGKLLDRMLGALGWSRQNVYIMNVIKCRPPGNRDPRPEEVAACSRWFDAQWELLQPKLVCLLGRVAAQRVLQSDASLSRLRGQWHEYRGVPVWVTYHPAYLLRTPTGKSAAWQDLQCLAARVRSQV